MGFQSSCSFLSQSKTSLYSSCISFIFLYYYYSSVFWKKIMRFSINDFRFHWNYVDKIIFEVIDNHKIYFCRKYIITFIPSIPDLDAQIASKTTKWFWATFATDFTFFTGSAYLKIGGRKRAWSQTDSIFTVVKMLEGKGIRRGSSWLGCYSYRPISVLLQQNL